MPQLDFAMYSTMSIVFSFYFVGFFTLVTYLVYRYVLFCQLSLFFLKNWLRKGYTAAFLFIRSHMNDAVWGGYFAGLFLFNRLLYLF